MINFTISTELSDMKFQNFKPKNLGVLEDHIHQNYDKI